MNLIGEMVGYCDYMYSNSQCRVCTGLNCSHNCKKCLDDIHFHSNNIRTKYDCERLLYYYLCRYSYKYCSEIVYALNEIELSNYPYFNIISLGCGGAADLMAFDYLLDNNANIYYHGVDINQYWDDIHHKITSLYPTASFSTNFDIEKDMHKLNAYSYNVVIIEYLISYLYSPDLIGKRRVEKLFDDLIEYVVRNKSQDSPMLIIINDVDSKNTGRDEFEKLKLKLKNKGYGIKVYKRHFKKNSYYENSIKYKSSQNLFECPWYFQQEYCVALRCESAQMIIEVE